MSNHPSTLSPRQRMINMMYLVLTALLALNISNEVFNLVSSKNIQIKDIKKIVGFDSEFLDNTQSNIQIYKINTKKIAKIISLSSSENAIREYYNSLQQ